MPVRKYLPSAIAVAWLAATPAFAADHVVAPPAAVGSGKHAPALASRVRRLRRRRNHDDWRGLYVGGQFSYSDGNADFSKSTQEPIAYSSA